MNLGRVPGLSGHDDTRARRRLTAFTIESDGALTDAPGPTSGTARRRTAYATDWERLDWQHGGGERTGQVLTYRAPAAHAGHP